jgi:hypothetical protein
MQPFPASVVKRLRDAPDGAAQRNAVSPMRRPDGRHDRPARQLRNKTSESFKFAVDRACADRQNLAWFIGQ